MKDVDETIAGLIWSEFDKPERIEAFYSVRDRLTNVGYWRLLGQIYQVNESLYKVQHLLPELLLSSRPGRISIMDDDDRLIYNKLKKTINVYRGCWRANAVGWSWTTSKTKAEWFASRCPLDNKPLVIVGQIAKEDIIAAFAGPEKEVVAAPNSVRIKREIRLPFAGLKGNEVLFQKIQAGEWKSGIDTHMKLATVIINNAQEKAIEFWQKRINRLLEYGFEKKAKQLQEEIELLQNPSPEMLAWIDEYRKNV